MTRGKPDTARIPDISDESVKAEIEDLLEQITSPNDQIALEAIRKCLLIAWGEPNDINTATISSCYKTVKEKEWASCH